MRAESSLNAESHRHAVLDSLRGVAACMELLFHFYASRSSAGPASGRGAWRVGLSAG